MRCYPLNRISSALMLVAGVFGTLVSVNQPAQAQAQPLPTDIVGRFDCRATGDGWRMLATHRQFDDVTSQVMQFGDTVANDAENRCNVVAQRFNAIVATNGGTTYITTGFRNSEPVICSVPGPNLTCSEDVSTLLVTLPSVAVYTPVRDSYLASLLDHMRYLDRSPVIHSADPITGLTSPADAPLPLFL